MAVPSAASILEIDLNRLRNALRHLESSNKDLQEALQEDKKAGRPLDPEYKQALNENIVTIAKQRARIEGMERELAQLKGKGVSAVSGADVSQPGDQAMLPTSGHVAPASYPSAPAAAATATPMVGMQGDGTMQHRDMDGEEPPAAAPMADTQAATAMQHGDMEGSELQQGGLHAAVAEQQDLGGTQGMDVDGEAGGQRQRGTGTAGDLQAAVTVSGTGLAQQQQAGGALPGVWL